LRLLFREVILRGRRERIKSIRHLLCHLDDRFWVRPVTPNKLIGIIRYLVKIQGYFFRDISPCTVDGGTCGCAFSSKLGHFRWRSCCPEQTLHCPTCTCALTPALPHRGFIYPDKILPANLLLRHVVVG
tara:strand:+ start:2862 stop:3248 length:387 start_codon:yes stop_codon:yes gene_type:complete